MPNFGHNLSIFLVFFALVFNTGTNGQTQIPAMVVDQGEAVFTFTLPNTVADARLIYIKLDPEDGTVFDSHTFRIIIQKTVRVPDAYASKIKGERVGNDVKLTISPVSVSDAGYYRCYKDLTKASLVENCGRRLILLRPPDDPTIIFVPPDDKLLVGSRLRLACQSSSNSRPEFHGLGMKVSWKDGQGNTVTTSSRFYKDDNQDLVVDQLSRGDKYLQFSCEMSDDTGGGADYAWSKPSSPYTLKPEYAPTQSDLKVTPPFEEGALIIKKIGEKMEYMCEADCNPECEVIWMYKANTNGAKYGEVQDFLDPSYLAKDGLSRWDPGTYRCRARNEHSDTPVKTTFRLELSYIEAPQVYINEQAVTDMSVWENEDPVEFKCIFDANPRPFVTWLSPSGQELQSMESEGLQKRTNPESGLPESLYTSTLYLDSLTCEDRGGYSCLGKNGDMQVEGDMSVNVKCKPRSSDVPGERLEEEYAWEIPEPFKFQFVIRGWPAPKIRRIMSSVNDETRNEVLDKDIVVTTTTPYQGKQCLTEVSVQSKRPLTQADSGRRFILEFFSADFESKLDFKIRLRGPPHEVHNITLENINHHSVDVFWQAGFDGGEEQSFSIQYRKKGKDGEEASSDWKVAVKDISVMPQGLWQTAKMENLHSDTEYTGRIIASSVLGSAITEFSLKTTSAPSGGLSAGAVVGIVFACLIFVVIVAALIYWFVLRKRLGKGGEHFSIAGHWDTLKKLIKRDESKPTENGGANSGSRQPKKNPIYRMKKMVKKIPKKLKKDYNAVPKKAADEGDDDYSPDEFDDDDTYMNTNEMKTPKPDEIVYANACAIRKNAEEKKKMEGREKNDDGLIYVTVDHQNSNLAPSPKNSNNNNNNRAGTTKDSSEPAVLFKPEDDTVEYSQVDFTKTPLKNGIHQEVRAEVNPTVKHEKEKEVDVAVVQPEQDDVASAADGGAEVEAEDGGADPLLSSNGVVPESRFGTTV